MTERRHDPRPPWVPGSFRHWEWPNGHSQDSYDEFACHLMDFNDEFADIEESIKEQSSTTHQDILDSRQATLPQCILDCQKLSPNDGTAAEAAYASQDRASMARDGVIVADIPRYYNSFFDWSPQTSNRGLYDFNDSQEDPLEDGHISPLIKQPETRPTSQEQLVAEVKGDNLAFGSKGRISRQRSYLPVLVEGNAARALPDTEAGYNVVTENFAASIGAALDRDPRLQRTFTNAVGRKFQSCGIAELNISLPKDSGKVSRSKFAVLKNCAEPLVLGNPFLKENEIFTKVGYSHDLVKAVSSSIATSSKKMFRVMHMEQPRQKLTCALDSQYALANADTGSDIDLVSLHYAQSRGWKIKRLGEHEESYVMLADEEEVQLAGYVDACLSVEGNEMMKRFYVLPGLVCDIILGDPTLESLDVFKNFKDAFVDWSQGKDLICMITWAKRFDKVGEDVEDILRRLDHAGGLSEDQSDRPWLWSLFSRRTKEPHRSDLEDTKYQLQSQLHKADSIETKFRTEFAKKEVWLKDNALRREQEEDGRRREKHDELRRRILKHIDNLSNQGSEPGDPQMTKAEHALR